MKANRPALIGLVLISLISVWALSLHLGWWPPAANQIDVSASSARVEATNEPLSAAVTPTAVATIAEPTTTPTPFPTLKPPTPRVRATQTPVVAATPMITDIPYAALTPTATAPSARTAVPNYTEDQRLLVVDQDEQIMYVYEQQQLIRLIPVSTGAPVVNAFTPAWQGKVGSFWGKAAFRNTNLWADYIWYLFPGSEGSILIHSVPYTNSGEDKIYDNLEALGVRPASKGCIRISPEDAKWLAAWNPVGVPIEITAWSGDIAPVDDGS